MSDRELLELAAKAAGFEYLQYVPERYPGRAGLLHGNPKDPNGRLFVWNPLLDDGEALRLAAKVGLRVNFDYRTGIDQRPGVAVWTSNDQEPYPPFWSANSNDINRDARHTIVRAAASLAARRI